ncbi:MAG: hypothetical protein EOO01_10675, partial [Chitinophagaceae bacterium]
MMLYVTSNGQKSEQYSRAKIWLNATDHSLTALGETGLAIDHGDYKRDTWFVSDFSDAELAAAREKGFRVDVQIPDVTKHYQQQNNPGAAKTTLVSCDKPHPPTPSHFHLGSYGGYYTYDELLDILDSMQLLYPNLISVRQAIGTYQTIEGRPIYWLRVSNNPAINQPAKPQMLYNALHHAREPGSISQLVFYLWHLLENYNTDAKIKSIVDNTELYFIPCVNPDG